MNKSQQSNVRNTQKYQHNAITSKIINYIVIASNEIELDEILENPKELL